MSTLKVNNLQDVNGANNSTPEQVAQGRAKAWIRFDMSGTASISNSYNVSSIADTGQGRFTITWSTAMADANYAYAFGGSNPYVTGHSPNQHAILTTHLGTPTTTQMFVQCFHPSTSSHSSDDSRASVIVMGD